MDLCKLRDILGSNRLLGSLFQYSLTRLWKLSASTCSSRRVGHHQLMITHSFPARPQPHFVLWSQTKEEPEHMYGNHHKEVMFRRYPLFLQVHGWFNHPSLSGWASRHSSLTSKVKAHVHVCLIRDWSDQQPRTLQRTILKGDCVTSSRLLFIRFFSPQGQTICSSHAF